MKQPNVKVWPDRLAETPIRADEKPFEWYRRLSETYNVSFETARTKAQRYIKGIKNKEELAVGINPIIDAEGIDFDNVKHGWLKTKFNKDGRAHSLFFKTDQEGDFLEKLTESIKEYNYQAPTPSETILTDHIGLINIFDSHIDKLCTYDQTNEVSSLENNVQHFKQAFVNLFHKCQYAERILFPIGNDFFNANDEKNTTVKGTPQDSFFDWKHSFNTGLATIRWCIDYCLKHGKPVDVITVYSNHDATKLFYLATCLKLIYETSTHVTVELQSIQRKYYQYGECLFGFAHGDKERTNALPSLMASEKKKEWGNTSHRFWFLGDKHHEKQFVLKKSLDTPSVEIHWLRAVATTDNWHYQAGYIGIPKTAYCYIFHKQKGLITIHKEPF